MSITNEERRDAAARLRAIEVPDRIWRLGCPELIAAWYELICAAVGGKKDPWFGVKALGDRLADLIDPCDDPSSQCHKTLGRCDEVAAADATKPAADTTKCDRAALLDLADGIDDMRRDVEGGLRAKVPPQALDGWARRIREACGGAS